MTAGKGFGNDTYKSEKALIQESFKTFVKDKKHGLAPFLISFEQTKGKAPDSISPIKEGLITTHFDSRMEELGYENKNDTFFMGLMPIPSDLSKHITRSGVNPAHYYFLLGLKQQVVFNKKKYNILGSWTLRYEPASGPPFLLAITHDFQEYLLDNDGSFQNCLSLGKN
jgi:hypothetical protein